MDPLLREIYYNPETGGTKLDTLYRRAKNLAADKGLDISVTKEKVSDWLAKQKTHQLYATTKTQNATGHVAVGPPGYEWHCDLIVMSTYKGVNPLPPTSKGTKGGTKGGIPPPSQPYEYIFFAVDKASKKIFCEPQVTKESKETAESINKILDRAEGGIPPTPPSVITTDDGGEFKDQFRKNAEHKFQLYNARSGDHGALAVMENAIKQFKQLLFANISNEEGIESEETRSSGKGNKERLFKWPLYLQKVVDNYNKTERKSLFGLTPNEAYEDKSEEFTATLEIKNSVNQFINQTRTKNPKKNELLSLSEKKALFLEGGPSSSSSKGSDSEERVKGGAPPAPLSPGTKVRIITNIHKQGRSFKPQFSVKLYTIVAVNDKSYIIDIGNKKQRRVSFHSVKEAGVPLDKDTYEVEKVLDKKVQGGRLMHLVKYVDYKDPEWTEYYEGE
jgi:hypothetical protein